MLALGASGCILDRSGTLAPGSDGGQPDDAGARFDAGRSDAATPADGAVPDASGLDASRPDGGPVPQAPGPPGTPTFSDVTDTSVRVAWAPPTTGGPAERYELERAPDEGGAPGPFATAAAPTSPAHDDAGLAAATTYWYRVRGINGVGPGDFSAAASVTTTGPLVVTRVQLAIADGFDPTARFDTPPTAGNLLVAIGFHRTNDARPRIDGWDLRVDRFFRTSDGNRRGLAVLTRVAAAGESPAVHLEWSEARETHLLVQELRAGPGATWSFQAETSADSGASTTNSLSVATGPIATGDALLIGAFGSRDDPGGEVDFTGLGDGVTRRGARSVASAFGLYGGGGPPATTASWRSNQRATVALVVFGIGR